MSPISFFIKEEGPNIESLVDAQAFSKPAPRMQSILFSLKVTIEKRWLDLVSFVVGVHGWRFRHPCCYEACHVSLSTRLDRSLDFKLYFRRRFYSDGKHKVIRGAGKSLASRFVLACVSLLSGAVHGKLAHVCPVSVLGDEVSQQSRYLFGFSHMISVPVFVDR